MFEHDMWVLSKLAEWYTGNNLITWSDEHNKTFSIKYCLLNTIKYERIWNGDANGNSFGVVWIHSSWRNATI